MASFKIEDAGLDGFIHNLEMLGESTEELVGDMLSAGGEVMANAWKDSIKEHDYIDTGAMLDSVKNFVKPQKSITEIYPKGKDKKGVRNAEKAFILNYGTSASMDGKGIRGSRFVEQLEKDAEDDIIDAMTRVKDEYIEKSGL